MFIVYFTHTYFLRWVGYDGRMKSKLDSTTTPEQKYGSFEAGLRRILTVSKDDLAAREKEYQETRPKELRRGPKPKR